MSLLGKARINAEKGHGTRGTDGLEGLQIDREIGNGTERDLSNLSNVLDASGDLELARSAREEALQGFRKQGDKNNEAITLTNLAGLLLKIGDVAGAKRSIEQAIAIQRETGHKRGLGFSLFFEAQVLSAQDRLQESQDTAEQTIALRKELKDDLHIPESEMLLAEVLLERDKNGEAQPFVERAAAAFEKQGVTDLAAQSYADLTRALLAQGKLTEANAAAGRALALARRVIRGRVFHRRRCQVRRRPMVRQLAHRYLRPANASTNFQSLLDRRWRL